MDVKPIPLSPRPGGSDPSGDSARSQAMENAEREFHAMLLREMLRPLTQALFASENGFSSDSAPLGASGQETYAYFLEQALSEQLAQGWPLPSLFGEGTSPAGDSLPLPAPAQAARSNSDLGTGMRLPTSLRGVPLPAAPAPARRAPMPLPADPASRTSTTRLPASLDPVKRLDPREDPAAPSAEAAPPAPGEPPDVGVALPDTEIRRAARLFDLPENLVRAVVLTESGGRADAVSPEGAVGYMQVLPSTGKEMGASNLRDPWQNLYAGAKYLRKQLDRFGNLEHALAAYNAGPGAVERHGGIPPYRETRNYVRRVFSWMDRLERSGS